MFQNRNFQKLYFDLILKKGNFKSSSFFILFVTIPNSIRIGFIISINEIDNTHTQCKLKLHGKILSYFDLNLKYICLCHC